mgnify:CR=1 FL=1
MIQRLIEAGIVRDVGIFATAAIGLQLANAFRKTPTHPLFSDYPAVRSSPFLKPLITLSAILEECDLLHVIQMCDSLLHCAAESRSTRSGFQVNRLAAAIPQTVERLVKDATQSRDLDIAIRGMDFQRDELPFVETICDNMVRNMLLDAHPYA